MAPNLFRKTRSQISTSLPGPYPISKPLTPLMEVFGPDLLGGFSRWKTAALGVAGAKDKKVVMEVAGFLGQETGKNLAMNRWWVFWSTHLKNLVVKLDHFPSGSFALNLFAQLAAMHLEGTELTRFVFSKR